MTLLGNRYSKIVFYKMEGNGNDFVVIDNTSDVLEERVKSRFSQTLCDRRFGVGADGVIFIERSELANYRMRLFNADGSEAEMCGNGIRCFAFFCSRVKGFGGDTLRIETGAGMIETWFEGDLIGLSVGEADDKGNPLRDYDGVFVNVGVPHYVIMVEDVSAINVESLGKRIRYRKEFAEGTNVDFVEYVDEHTIKVRTYERGVEAETLSCGTGAVASAYVVNAYGKCRFPVTVVNIGGKLRVDVKDNFEKRELLLFGKARIVFKGEWIDE